MREKQHLQELVERAGQGNREAFDTLFNQYRSRLLSRINRRLSDKLRRRVEPEDILQEAFCRAFETIDGFRWRGEDSFFAWIAAIAEHLILNASKKHQFKALQLGQDFPQSGATPGKILSREERYERLRSSIQALTSDQRKAVVLARIDGLTMREIASRMGRSEEAVRQLLARSLRQLKRTFGDTESLHLPNRSLGEEGLDDD